MLKQELKRILKNKLLYVGFLIVLVIMFIGFYSDTLADKDGNTYITNIETNERAHLTQYEKIQYQKTVCAPYIGRQLDDDMIVDFLNIMFESQTYQKQFIYEETPMLNIALSYMRAMWPYSEARLESLGEGYRKVDLNGGSYIIAYVDTFIENNDLSTPVVIDAGYGWLNLLDNLSTSYTIGLIVLAVVLIGVFSSDNRYNIKGMVLSTRYGRSKNVIMRVAASFIVVCTMFVLITVIDTSLYLSVYGKEGFATPLYMTEFGQTLYNGIEMSVGTVYVQYIIIGVLCYLTVTAFALMISSMVKSEYIGAIISVILLLFPWMVSELFTINQSTVNSILNITPINLFNLSPSNNGVLWYAGEFAFANMGGDKSPISFGVPLFIVYMIFYMVFFILTYIVSKKKEVL